MVSYNDIPFISATMIEIMDDMMSAIDEFKITSSALDTTEVSNSERPCFYIVKLRIVDNADRSGANRFKSVNLYISAGESDPENFNCLKTQPLRFHRGGFNFHIK